MGSFHKWFLLFLILVLPVFVAKQYRILRDKKGASYIVESDFYHANPYNPNDKNFVVIITSRNVAPFIERNLESVFKQDYPNYRVILIDQTSTDGTYEKAEAIISQRGGDRKIEVIRRPSEGAVFQTYYQMVKEANDHDIVVHLPGGDWLANEHTLSTLNQIYRNQDVWLTYPQYVEYPSYKKGVLKALPKKHIHKRRVHRTPWAASPLKTFYAGILKQVEIEAGAVSLFADGEKALMLPMAEIGKSHVRFIKEVLYVHTSQEDQDETARMEHLHADTTDVILFSLRGGQSLHFAQEALEKHLIGKKKITVIRKNQFKETLLAALKHDLVMFTTDENCLNHPIDLKRCARLLKENRAYGCYFDLKGEKLDLLRFVDQGVYVWDIHRGEGDFHHPDWLYTAIYERSQLIRDLQTLEFTDFNSLKEAWQVKNNLSRRGLLFSFNESFRDFM